MPKMEMESAKALQGNGVHRESRGEAEMVDLKAVAESALCSFRDYARSNPETVALWCVGIGFVLGWKLRPW